MKRIINLTQMAHNSCEYSSVEIMNMHNQHLAKHCEPLDVVLVRGEGVYVYDCEGKKYYDFLSGYSALSQGHCHPKILKALIEQACTCSLTSRAFYNDQCAIFAEYITNKFGYDEVCPMNTGAEGVDTALKVARKWGYEVKGIPEGEAIIVACNENFHGRTFGAISHSSNPEVKDGFYPLLPNVIHVDFNDLSALEAVFKEHADNICGFIVEPIQGEAGVNVPDEGYIAGCKKLCEQYGILLICDEIQTGLGRTGRVLCVDYDNVKPDILILGKALGGGLFPISAVLADADVMQVLGTGTHGSTFGGNPLGSHVAMAAVDVVFEEKLSERAFEMGQIFRDRISELWTDDGIIVDVRGKGLLNAVQFNHDHPKMKEKGLDSHQICRILKTKGMLAKQTHETNVRFSPPLVFTPEQLEECIQIISSTIKEIES